MPNYFNPVRPDSRPWQPVTKISPLEDLPGVVSPPPEAPYPAADGAGDGASKGFRPACKTSGYSTNVPSPDNKGPVRSDSGDGKDGMAG